MRVFGEISSSGVASLQDDPSESHLLLFCYSYPQGIRMTSAFSDKLKIWQNAASKHRSYKTWWLWPSSLLTQLCWERLRTRGEGVTEDETVEWHHCLNGHEFEQLQDIAEDKEAWCAAAHQQRAMSWGHSWAVCEEVLGAPACNQ